MKERRKKPRAEAVRFSTANAGLGRLAIAPQAMNLFWLLGCGIENETHGRTTIVSVDGPLEQRACWWDGYDAILERFREACADESTTSIVLRMTSPGGDCAGLFECVRMMREAKQASGKRVIAYSDESCYSAAYAIACVADEIYLPPSGGVGSVGVICVAYDRVGRNAKDGINAQVIYAGAHKADAHPDIPLSEDAIAGIQYDVDKLADMFFDLVAEARGVDASDISALEANTFMGDDAIAAGLADGVMGFDELLAMVDEDGAPNGDKEEEDDMGAKNTAGDKKMVKTNAEYGANDAMSAPQVISPDGATLTAAAAALRTAADGPLPTASDDKDAKEEKDDEEDGDEEESEGGDDEESAEDEESEKDDTEAKDDEEDEDGDDDEEDGDDEDDDKEKPKGALPSIPRNATSGDVLKAIKEITGETSPGAMIGALHGIRDRAASADDAKKQAAKTAKKAAKQAHKDLVEKGIRQGKITPGQRAWALAQSTDTVRGYMKASAPVVARTPLRAKPGKSADGSTPPAKRGAPSAVSEAVANIARHMQMSPEAIQAHYDELKSKGVLH